MATDEEFMAEALALAAQGRGAVEPNPMVGAVLVRDGRIIGRGYHHRFGGEHAEVEALADARRAGQNPRGATLYVTLEPCCHFGKTPPCTQAVIDAGIARVVAALQDPDSRVAGQGFAALRAAGIAVVSGVSEEPARRLLAAYIKLRTRHRPWVIAKWAQTLDGKIATRTGHSRWITGQAARDRVHQVRAGCDGILVGVRTVLADDPQLTNRSGSGKSPTRVVLDAQLRTPPVCCVAATARQTPTLIATCRPADDGRAGALRSAGAEVLELPRGAGGVDLPALLDELGRRNWTYLLVEGGRGVLSEFLRQKLADELLAFVAPRILGGSESLGAVDWPDVDSIDEGLSLPAPEVELLGQDVLLRFVLSR